MTYYSIVDLKEYRFHNSYRKFMSRILSNDEFSVHRPIPGMQGQKTCTIAGLCYWNAGTLWKCNIHCAKNKKWDTRALCFWHLHVSSFSKPFVFLSISCSFVCETHTALDKKSIPFWVDIEQIYWRK